VLDDHGGAHQLVVGHGQHRAVRRGLDRRALVGLYVDAVVGAPVRHGLVIQQLRHAEHRDGGTVQRGNDLRQQLHRLLDDGGLLHGYLDRLRLDHGLVGYCGHGGDGGGLDLNDGVGLLDGGVGGKQGDIADGSGGQQAHRKGYVEALAAEHGLEFALVESAHTRLSGGTHPPPQFSACGTPE